MTAAVLFNDSLMKTNMKYDLMSLGEVMLRLDPGEGRIRHARHFQAWEGGGEYNVARGLARCFRKKTAILTSLAENELGYLLEEMMMQGGVDPSFIHWVNYDGVGRKVRNSLNFTERGFGLRGAKGMVDRGYSAASQLSIDSIDWESILKQTGWLHTGGIFAGLSEQSAELTKYLCQLAKKLGVTVSYDLNYRASLWQERGGFRAAQELNREVVKDVDVLFGVMVDDITKMPKTPSGCGDCFEMEAHFLQEAIVSTMKEYPQLEIVACTLRHVKSATINDWGALAYSQKEGSVRSKNYESLELMDRIGGGDGFVSGFVYGLIEKKSLGEAVHYGAAHGALAMTTPGDNSMATLSEIEKMVAGGDARVVR